MSRKIWYLYICSFYKLSFSKKDWGIIHLRDTAIHVPKLLTTMTFLWHTSTRP